MEKPVINVKYAGISGNIQGEKKDKSPARKAAEYETVSTNMPMTTRKAHNAHKVFFLRFGYLNSLIIAIIVRKSTNITGDSPNMLSGTRFCCGTITQKKACRGADG